MKKSIDNFLLEPNGYYLQVKEWHRRACPEIDCASALLSFLLFFHKHKQSMKEYARHTNEMLRKKGKPPIADETDWQFHTNEMLKRKLFYWSDDSIYKATVYLRDELRFIDTEAPEYLKKIYKAGRSKWFRILVPSVQQWIVDNYPLIEAEDEEIVTLSPVTRSYQKSAKYTEDAKRIFRFRQLLHGEPEEKPDKARLNKITARLKEGKDEIDLAFAVIGNLVSPWHKGDNPNSEGQEKKITYHLVRHIFKDAEKVTYFRMIAEGAGWTRAKVIAKYEELLNIKYENRTSLELNEASQTPEEKVEEARMYREIASLLTELVINKQMKLDQIMVEFYNRSDKLGFDLITLSNADRLGREIIECIAQNEIVASDRQNKIMAFAKTFIAKLRGAE